MKKNYLKIILGIVVVLGLYGCANLKNGTAISVVKKKNIKLEKDDAPIRLKYKEYDGGITYNPYLVGRITPTVASSLLTKDTLELIKKMYKDKEVSLVQTRFVTSNKALTSIKEVWVLKNEKNKMYAYLVKFIVTPTGGTDIDIHGGHIVFKEMLQE